MYHTQSVRLGKGVMHCSASDCRYAVYCWDQDCNRKQIKLSQMIKKNAAIEAGLQKIRFDTADMSFAETLEYHLKAMDMTKADLIEECGNNLDERTIVNMLSKAHWKCPQIKSIAIVTLSLHLRAPLGHDLMEKAGYSLKRNEEERTIAGLINLYYSHSIEECNEALMECGYAPLSN